MWDRKEARVRRHERLRRKVAGTPARPRLAVFRSSLHIYAQVIDDEAQKTLAHASSCEEEVRKLPPGTRKSAVAEAVGRMIAERCKAKGVLLVAFDTGGFGYHGRIAALAKAARTAGLKF